MMTRREWVALPVLFRRRPMVRLPGGRFRMGSEADAIDQFPGAGGGIRAMLRAETPSHEVTVAPFWMDRYEVTNADFQRFVHARPEWRKDRVGGNYLAHWDEGRIPGGQQDFPVVFVRWDAALAYARWAGKRLPTEAEWEFAARGGRSGMKYPWGSQEPDSHLANYADSRFNMPVKVGRYPPNPYGLYDLAGNVWEFCMDPWQNTYPAQAVAEKEADVQRMAELPAERRVIRGGSFGGSAFNMRITARDSHPVANPVGHVGFRCAKPA